MDDETSDELTTESEYSDSFIATDDSLEEELIWDSEDSRPAGPSPDTEPWEEQYSSLSPGSTPLVLSDSDETMYSPTSPLYSPTTPSWPNSPEQPPPANDQPAAEQGVEPEQPPSPDTEPVVVEVEVPPPPPESPPNPPPPPPPPEPATEVVTADVPKRAADQDQLDSSVLSEGEDNSLCTICMCPLTNSGAHRVVCLRCGHIFGQACVERWIKVGCNNGARRCPTCNKKACLKDIRVLYLPKVVPLDTVERDRLLQEKEQLAAQKKMLESDFTRTVLQHKLVVDKYEERIAALEKILSQGVVSSQPTLSQGGAGGFTVLTSVTINKDGGCRVMAFNRYRQELVVSQPTGTTMFAGFGIRTVNSVDWQPSRFVWLHAKPVRDMQFHPEDRDMLLTVSLDSNAKLFDVASNSTVHTFKGDGPLWSCCWDASHPHMLLLGSQLGKVVQYDRRMTDSYVNMWTADRNTAPVVALASSPCRAGSPMPQGGFMSCRLNAVYTYPKRGEKFSFEELDIDGPFMSMRYDDATQMMLTSARPSSRNQHTNVRLHRLDSDCDGRVCARLIHTFKCGSTSGVMSRSTWLPMVDDSLVVAHNESSRRLDVWSSKRGDLLHSVPVKESIIDLAPVSLCNNKPPLLAALSEKKLTVYRFD